MPYQILSEDVRDDSEVGFSHAALEIFLERIFVLIEPSSGFVFDFSGVMRGTKGGLGETRLHVFGMTLAIELVVKLVDEGSVSGFRKQRFFVQESQDA